MSALHNIKIIFSFFHSKAAELFSSPDEELQFADDFEFDEARATILEKMGRLSEAAELHLKEGRTLKGIRLFLKDNASKPSVPPRRECIILLLQRIWDLVSFDFDPAIVLSDEILRQFPDYGEQLLQLPLETNDRNEVSSLAPVFICCFN